MPEISDFTKAAVMSAGFSPAELRRIDATQHAGGGENLADPGKAGSLAKPE